MRVFSVPTFVVAWVLFFLPATQAANFPAKLGVRHFPPAVAEAVGFDSEAARIYHVVPISAAGKADLQPGDVIVGYDGKPVRTFRDLVGMVNDSFAGDEVKIEVKRDGKALLTTAVLSGFIGDVTSEAYAASLAYLETLRERHDSLALRREIASLYWETDRRGHALSLLENDLEAFPENQGLLERWLEYLQGTGDYDRYVEQAVALADRFPKNADFQLHKIDAMLATGDAREAERLAAQACKSHRDGEIGWRYTEERTLELWATARIRQGKPLSGPTVPVEVSEGPWESPNLDVFDYWRRQLNGKAPYRLRNVGGPDAVELKKASALLGLMPGRMHGIEIQVNGVDVPLAIVDTGASHTLLSVATAQAAGVAVGDSSRTAAGSLSFTSRPAFVKELRIGNLILENVPVNVGNPPPLVLTKARAAIGVDVMQHVRFTLDYLQGKVQLEGADSEPKSPAFPDAVWDVPMWTFASHTMGQIQTEQGRFGRVLIDSGNFATTLVRPGWASEVWNDDQPARKELEGLTLAGRKLPDWPAMDIPAMTLSGVDLLDLLMGHDLLSQYKATVDLRNGRLRLQSPGDALTPPRAIKPKGLMAL